jgi:large subunit ribosomal protein L34
VLWSSCATLSSPAHLALKCRKSRIDRPKRQKGKVSQWRLRHSRFRRTSTSIRRRPDVRRPTYTANMMQITRCIRSSLSALTKAPQLTQRRFAAPGHPDLTASNAQTRAFGVLSSLPTRPTLLSARPTLPATDITSSIAQPTSQTGLSLLQVRGAKRDTFNPSHVVRKRRHGFLSRIRTRTGRMTLKRRRAKGRSTLSH